MKTELELANERILELEEQVKKLSSNTVLAVPLPTDAEIEKYAKIWGDQWMYSRVAFEGYREGAKWMLRMYVGNYQPIALVDIQACIQNALHEKGISLLECLRVCDNILKHFDEYGMKVVRQ